MAMRCSTLGATLLGVRVLLAVGLLDRNDLLEASKVAGGPLALLFGGMVVARVLAKRVSFARFARYGVPITLVQLGVGALYVGAMMIL